MALVASIFCTTQTTTRPQTINYTHTSECIHLSSVSPVFFSRIPDRPKTEPLGSLEQMHFTHALHMTVLNYRLVNSKNSRNSLHGIQKKINKSWILWASLTSDWLISNVTRNKCTCKKGSPYLITERRVPELIPVLGSQPAGDASHKPSGRLLLLCTRPAVTHTTLKRAATNFAAWWTEAQMMWAVCLRLFPTASRLRFEPRPFCAWVQHANQSATEPHVYAVQHTHTHTPV